MRILITGSRNWTDKDAILAALRKHANKNGDSVVVHGHCSSGADKLADELAQEYRVRTEHWPADWTAFGKRAGFVRNNVMVELGADVCLAFIRPCTKEGCQKPKPHGSHGATHCADAAEKAGIPTYRYTLSS